MRFAANNNIEFGPEAYKVGTTAVKRFSRLMMENSLKLKKGDPVVLCFIKGATLLDKRYVGKPQHTAQNQRECGIDGKTVYMLSNQYIVLKATMHMATLNHNIQHSNMVFSNCKTLFYGRQGFGVKFDGTDSKITLL